MASQMLFCTYCNVAFKSRKELKVHSQTQEHEIMVMSDEGRDWVYRPPPRGFKCDTYMLCQKWSESETCRFGMQCVEAHGSEELLEWQERFKYREMKLSRARDKELFGKSFTETLLEKWSSASNPANIMQPYLDGVEVKCSSPSSVMVSSKSSNYSWTFVLKSARPLKTVALLQDAHRIHFHISSVSKNSVEAKVGNNQEWISHLPGHNAVEEYKVMVVFKTGIYGTFRQSVVFDFGAEPYLVKHLCADLVPEDELKKVNKVRNEIVLSTGRRWTTTNCKLVPFHSQAFDPLAKWENDLKTLYPCPQRDNFTLSASTIKDRKLRKNNYRERIHELLYIEEMARYDLIAKYNLRTELRVVSNYILSPNSTAASSAKYSANQELFATFKLAEELSEDTPQGRLILMHCQTVYLSSIGEEAQGERRQVYEAIIEDKCKNVIYLRLSKEAVENLHLKPDKHLEVDIQFHLNRLPYCELHYILDRLTDLSCLFPDTYLEPVIPWSPSRQWAHNLDPRLNVKQKEAVVAITTPLDVVLPPILIIGPFGTGKTFTLAQAVRNLIKDSTNRVLLCTHSNSAADLYINDYLDKWVEEGDENARPLRIYYEKRWVSTVSQAVQKYCLINESKGLRSFRLPALAELHQTKVVVVTLSTATCLSTMNLPRGFFTHILVDEAAQALETETTIPLALANRNTRIVLAGDHMQIGPDVFSVFAKERNLHVSLLERLYDHYPKTFSCAILLCENYRSHDAIIRFASESFYDQKLIASSNQPGHDKYHPLSFFTSRGEDVQDKNSTAFYNLAEVFEVVERVIELKKIWPENWGEHSIGVVTPYSDQVFRIRGELRKKRIYDVCVERVLNVQGKQFRVIILSTVRTRKTCSNLEDDDKEYGFLSNSKLLNTAITRAQSLVAVIGDPVALCTVGRCSKVWEDFLKTCSENDSLHGMTWSQLKYQLDSIELKKIYTLNPLAPEFVPRRTVMVYPTPTLPQPQLPPVLHLPRLAAPTSQLYPSPSPVMVIPTPPPPPPALIRFPTYRLGPPLIYSPLPYSKPLPPRFPTQTLMNVPSVVKTPHKPTPVNSNKLIEFVGNVHFPEIPTDLLNLLPHNVSLAEMLLQAIEVQEKWTCYLKENCGNEAADRFEQLLQLAHRKGSRKQAKMTFECVTPKSSSSTSSSTSPTLPNNTTEKQNGENVVYSMLELNDVDLQKQIDKEFSRADSNNATRTLVTSQCARIEVPHFYKYFE